jgi:hypothetical protein
MYFKIVLKLSKQIKIWNFLNSVQGVLCDSRRNFDADQKIFSEVKIGENECNYSYTLFFKGLSFKKVFLLTLDDSWR